MHIVFNPLWGESANRVARSLLFGDLRFQIDRVIYSHLFGLVSGVFRASNRHNSSFSVITVQSNQSEPIYTHRFGRGSDWKFQASALHVTKVSETHPVGKIHVSIL